MKKVFISLLIIILLSIFMVGTVYAAQLETTIDITSNVTEVDAGDKVVFTFALKNVKNAKDNSIGAIEGVVTYDTNFFELVTGVTNTTFSAGGESGEKFNVLCGDAKEGDTIAILTLKVKDNPTGSGVVKFTDLAASDGDTERGDEAIAKTADKSIEIKLKSANPTEPKVNVTGITVEPTTGTIKEGKSITLTAKITPTNATNKNVKWTSSDETVATVNSAGVVTGIKEGTATITATTEDGNKTAKIEIKVEKVEVTPTDPDDENKDNNQNSNDQTITIGGDKTDTTIADTTIPKAGTNAIIITIAITISVFAIFLYKKNQKFKDIK